MGNYGKKIIEKINSFKDLSTIGAASLIGNGISSIFWLILASLMEAEQYGEINYFIAIASVASAASFLGAGNTLMVFSAKEKNIQSPILIVTSIAGIVAALVLFVMFSNVAISIYVVGYIIFNHLLYESLGKKLYPSYSKYFVIQRILLVVFALGLYFVMGPIGVVFGYAFSFFPFIIKSYKKYKISRLEFSMLREKIPFMRDSYGISMMSVFSTYTDKIIVGPLFGFSFLGNYQLAFQILMIMLMIPTIVYSYLLPQEASGKPHKKLWLIAILIVTTISVITIILSPSILPALMPKYTPAIDLIQIMSIAAIPMTISFRYMSKFLGDEKSKIVILGKIIFLSTQIIGIFSLGTELGAQGVAISLVVASTLEASYFVIVNRVLGKKS